MSLIPSSLFVVICGAGSSVLNKLFKCCADCIDFIFNDYAEAENNSNILLLADTFLDFGLGVEKSNQQGPFLQLAYVPSQIGMVIVYLHNELNGCYKICCSVVCNNFKLFSIH